jgi:hypothetical protein
VAVATALGPVIYFNARTKTEEGRIDVGVATLAISDDGSILAAASQGTIKIFALPSAALLATFPYSSPGALGLVSMSLSGSGTRVGKVVQFPGVFPIDRVYQRDATPIGGSPVVWFDSIQNPTQCFLCGAGDVPVLLSPDGTSIAVSNHTRVDHAGTNLYENGVLVGAVPGWAVGWIDDDRLLVNVYNLGHTVYPYRNALIVSATGATLATPPLREIHGLQRLTPDTIYSPDTNLILSVTTGATLWSSPNLSKGGGAVAGGRVVFPSGAHVRAEPH